MSTVDWDFGDGATLTAAPPVEHTYAAAGTYTVSASGAESTEVTVPQDRGWPVVAWLPSGSTSMEHSYTYQNYPNSYVLMLDAAPPNPFDQTFQIAHSFQAGCNGWPSGAAMRVDFGLLGMTHTWTRANVGGSIASLFPELPTPGFYTLTAEILDTDLTTVMARGSVQWEVRAGSPPAVVFDPADHTVAEVIDYVDAHPTEADAIEAAERDGKNRSTLIAYFDGRRG